MTLEFLMMLAPFVTGLALLGYVTYRLCGRVEELEARCNDIERVDDDDGIRPHFEGTICWPVDTEDLMESLRSYAGDADDTRRKQLEAAILLDGRRH